MFLQIVSRSHSRFSHRHLREVQGDSRVAASPKPVPRTVERSKLVKMVKNVVNIHEGDLHLHEHAYDHGAPRRRRTKAGEVRIEPFQKPQRDARYEKLLKERLERVKAWEVMFR